jgi:transposase InsO family protein
MRATSTKDVTTAEACKWYKISRQAHYQGLKRHLKREADNELIVTLVKAIRQQHPRMGGRKLHHKLQAPMAALEIQRGRDAFFDILRQEDLLVPYKRSQRRTTYAGWYRFPNLIKDLEITRINQVWVGDITYIATEEGFVYLALLTDVFSRFIVGYDVSSSLAVEGSLRALDNAIGNTSEKDLENLIHHSDHGVQYTALPYQDRMQKVSIKASMGEVGNCYDNALAERVNGILKNEYYLDALFLNLEHAHSSVKETINLYNFDRPHLSLGMATPADFYCLN